MDIHSGGAYPSNALSNFAPHPFILDGISCASAEGVLQSVKFKSPDMQRHICTLVGKAAKSAGANKNWRQTQTLYWQGTPMLRRSEEYQLFLDRLYEALATNEGFKKALLATGNNPLTHKIGKTKYNETVLTTQEFISRLYKIREKLQNDI